MARSLCEDIYFIAARRTPFGSFLGSLASLSATDLGVIAAQSALTQANIKPANIDHVIYGNVLQTSKDAIYLARHVGLRCEIPSSTPALCVNRLCGSGFEAIIQGARLLATQEAHCVLVGGSENMSQAPHVLRGARRGLALGQGQLEDSLWESLNDTYINMNMALTAEKLGIDFAISQEQVDLFCLQSQKNYQEALKQEVFRDEIQPTTFGTASRPQILNHDEHPRPDTSLELLQKLPKVFKPNGLIHAAAASGICDGAAALIMCSRDFLDKQRIKPLAQLVSFATTGCDPEVMGIGPVSAIKSCLLEAHMTLDHINMIEINEAFAPQTLAVLKALELNPEKINIHGGALAIGHPLGASGARLATHIIHSLKTQREAYGLAAACIGGGQGIALLIKSCGEKL